MANPPVCRIMDYGKFKFDEAQKAKESRRKTVHVGILSGNAGRAKGRPSLVALRDGPSPRLC